VRANARSAPPRSRTASRIDSRGTWEAAKAFDKALDDKFGKDPNCRSCFALQSKPAKRVELRGKKDLGGGKVELTIWTVGEVVFETREVAIRKNGGWVLVAPVPFTLTTSTEETRTVDGREVKVQVMAQAPEVTSDHLAAGRVAFPQMQAVLVRAAKDVAASHLESFWATSRQVNVPQPLADKTRIDNRHRIIAAPFSTRAARIVSI
jgi:hypothetical protein